MISTTNHEYALSVLQEYIFGKINNDLYTPMSAKEVLDIFFATAIIPLKRATPSYPPFHLDFDGFLMWRLSEDLKKQRREVPNPESPLSCVRI